MSKFDSSWKSELRISPKLVSVALALLGMASVVVGEKLTDTSQQFQVTGFFLLLYAAVAIVWLLASWRPEIGRVFAIVTMVAVIYVGEAGLGMPALLSLAGIPTVLAAAMIGLPAALVTAVGETALFVMLSKYGAPGADGATLAIPMMAAVIVLVAMYALYHRVYGLGCIPTTPAGHEAHDCT